VPPSLARRRSYYMLAFRFMHTLTSVPILDRLGALGDESRSRILVLLERSELTVTELASALGLAQPTVSRHLKALSQEGWVEARPDGRNRHYRLARTLDEAARAVWSIVRDELRDGVYAVDAERARAVMEERRRRSQEFFASAAERWDEVRERLFGSAAGLTPLLGMVDRDSVVADLGVGTGALAERLAPFAGQVVGVDGSEQMLAAARLRVGSLPNVELKQGTLEKLPIDGEALDAAFVCLVLHHVVDPPAALAEIRRALKPGGRLILVDMRRYEGGPWYGDEMEHVWPGFEPDQIDAWLSRAGFANTRVVPLPADPQASGPLLFLASALRP